MDLTELTVRTPCDCLTGANENTIDRFVRKVRKSQNLNIADFRNHFERNKVMQDPNDCSEYCGMLGVSIELWNESSQPALLEKYRRTTVFSPKAKNNLCVVQFKAGSSHTKHTPDQVHEFNEYHYDLYKGNSFSIESLEVHEMITLTT
jgi:hypothetical protein